MASTTVIVSCMTRLQEVVIECPDPRRGSCPVYPTLPAIRSARARRVSEKPAHHAVPIVYVRDLSVSRLHYDGFGGSDGQMGEPHRRYGLRLSSPG